GVFVIRDRRMKYGQDPLINIGSFVTGYVCFGVLELVDIGIQGKKCVGVQQGAEEFSFHFVDCFDVEILGLPGRTARNQEPSHAVGAVLSDYLERIDGIPAALRHLLTVLVENQVATDDVLETWLFKKECADGVQRIKPTACLI